jgi:phospholipid transport system transporter-binding protein
MMAIAESGSRAVGVSGFSADATGARWRCSGTLTFAEAGSVLTAAAALALPTEGIVDCDGIAAFDSAAVAVLLAVKRRGASEGRRIAFAGLPARLVALAALYDVEEMLSG